ncbi:MAG TPA: T9SS type B sorting domain-containing protein [Paludibacteraceae bacterium]|nr:T9SS type B sorting domain-containing protein [Paludibacteraceae bacterium]
MYIFKEDFGGNLDTDPLISKTPVEQCTIEFGDDPRHMGVDNPGKYAIRKVGVVHQEWYLVTDHTSPNDSNKGYFMQVDGSSKAGVFYNKVLYDVCAGSKFVVSMWGMSTLEVYNVNRQHAKIKMIVADARDTSIVIASREVTLENGKGFWEMYDLDFTVPANIDSVAYLIVNNSNTSEGNDFCLDDIEVKMCFPKIQISGNNTTYCSGHSLNLKAFYEDQITGSKYVWYKSDTATYDNAYWTKCAEGETLNIDYLHRQDAGYYRVQVYNPVYSSSSINYCNPLSDMIPVNVETCVDDSCPDGVLIFKEDFGGNSTLDPAISTDPVAECTYHFNDYPNNNGYYSISKVGFNHSSNAWYYPIYDHTYPNDPNRGYFMQIDAAVDNGIFYSIQIDSLCAGSELYLSMYGMSSLKMPGYDHSILNLVIEDAKTGVELQSKTVELLNEHNAVWERCGMKFVVSDSVTSIVYKIVNKGVSTYGNDFCLDDIEVRLCAPSVEVTGNDSTYCVGKSMKIEAEVDDGNTYEYIWYKSDVLSYDNQFWKKYAEGKTLEIDSVILTDAGFYRVQAYNPNAVSNAVNYCNPMSDIIPINVELCCEDVLDTLITHTCLSQYGIYSTDVDQLVQALEGNVSLPDSIWGTTDSIKATLCDTIRSQVTVLDMNPYTKDYLSLKQGTVYSDYGTNFTVQNDTSFVAFVANGGCESIFNVTITVIEPVEDTVVTNVCLSQYDVYGTDQNQLIQALEGYIVVPDSVWGMTETITVGVSDTIRKHVTVVEKNPYTKDYLSLKQGTVYSDYGANFTVQHDTSFVAFVANGGCESVFKVKITVVEDFEETVVTNVCLSEYDVYGTDQNQLVQALEGNIIAPDSVWGNTDTIAAGLTDTIRKHVTVVEKNPYTKDYLSLKQGTVYSDYGVNFTVQHDTSFVAFVANGGCESIFNVTITVIEPVEDTLVTNVCLSQYGVYGTDQNQLVQALEGNIIAPDSVWGMTETITVGVSDTIRNNVTVVEKNPYTKENLSLKQGTVYSDYGTNFTVQHDTSFVAFVANGGCESIFNVTITVIEPVEDTLVTNVCLSQYGVYGTDQNQLVQALEGNIIAPDSVWGMTETITVGVSDTIRNNVTVVEKNPYAKMAVSLKQGTVYSDYGTNFTVQNDTSFIAFVANGGCDSVFNVQLNVLKPFRDTVATHVCLSDYDVYSNDQTLLVKALKGNVVVPSPVIGETDTISGVCDTLRTQVTIVDMNPYIEVNVARKVGSMYTEHGENFEVEEYVSKLIVRTSSNGCDNLIQLDLQALKPYTDTLLATTCPNTPYYWRGTAILAASDTVVTKEQQSSSDAVCDSIFTLMLKVHAVEENNMFETVCKGELYDKHNYSFEAVNDTALVKHFLSYEGCDSTITVNLDVVAFDTIFDNRTVCEGSSVEFFGSSYNQEGVYSYKIADAVCQVHVLDLQLAKNPKILDVVTGDYGHSYSVVLLEENPSVVYFMDSIGNGSNNTFTDFEMGMHRVLVSDENNCKDSTTFRWFSSILPDDVFSPNGDGMNDRWTILNIEDYPDAKVSIYDRFGKEIAKYDSYSNEEGWDGTYKGNVCPSTDYWYEINIPSTDRQYVGHFTLMRF